MVRDNGINGISEELVEVALADAHSQRSVEAMTLAIDERILRGILSILSSMIIYKDINIVMKNIEGREDGTTTKGGRSPLVATKRTGRLG